MLYDAIILGLKVAGPMLAASIIIGLIIAIFQAATQIHEQTLTFVPKILVISLMLLLMGSTIITMFGEFFKEIFVKISNL